MMDPKKKNVTVIAISHINSCEKVGVSNLLKCLIFQDDLLGCCKKFSRVDVSAII